MQPDLAPRPLSQLLSCPFELGPAVHLGALTLFPVFGAPVDLDLVPLLDALEAGAFAKELPDQPSVNDLIFHNPTASSILLLDGEEMIGAQQNRVFDGSFIVPAKSVAHVAVCCVEQNRWDGARRHEHFRASPQVAHPGLRREMSTARSKSEVGRADQDRVWQSVAETLVSADVRSATGSLSDAYRGRDQTLSRMTESLEPSDGQLGAMAFIGGRFAAFDFVAHPRAFAQLHDRLVRGYALEALEVAEPDHTEASRAEEVLELVSLTLAAAAGPAGQGERLTIGREDTPFQGTGLSADGELVHCSVFPKAA